ncbi:MAG: PCMD domain-containing protein [Muribaculaceae bacterium]|jgi:hypothetical protein|nr:PCMD domain-containing protein [Muribaculaceae bacterium]
MKKAILTYIILLLNILSITAQKIEPIPFGDMDNWVTRNIKESAIIGGETKQVYAIGPDETIEGDEAYVPKGGSPWASSNVLAKVVGITKVSNTVYPDTRAGHGRCARMTTVMEHCKAIGLINIDVLVSGSIFLGQMFEPIKSTSNPYSKLEMGIPFTRRPSALVFDYRLIIPDTDMIYSSGFGKKRTIKGHDKAEVFIYLQRRWEDSDGKLHARRVGTGRVLLDKSSDGWVNGYSLKVNYGDISHEPYFTSRMELIPEADSYCARNSKGKIVPVVEEGWDAADATPTHIMVMFSAGSNGAYTGAPGSTFWVDNIALAY